MRIVFLGPPGAGKGTQALRLKDYLGLVHLSTGQVLRDAHEARTPLGREAATYFNAGKLVPDDVVVDIVVERLGQPDCAVGCLFDGFPRTVSQAEILDTLLANRGLPLDLVLAIDVPDDIVFRRLLGRGRTDDNEQTIRERLVQYRTLTEPLIEYYRRRGILRLVDGHGTEDQVFERVRRAADEARGQGGDQD